MARLERGPEEHVAQSCYKQAVPFRTHGPLASLLRREQRAREQRSAGTTRASEGRRERNMRFESSPMREKSSSGTSPRASTRLRQVFSSGSASRAVRSGRRVPRRAPRAQLRDAREVEDRVLVDRTFGRSASEPECPTRSTRKAAGNHGLPRCARLDDRGSDLVERPDPSSSAPKHHEVAFLTEGGRPGILDRRSRLCDHEALPRMAEFYGKPEHAAVKCAAA